MKTSHAAFRLMVQLAYSDGWISPDEERVLQRYRRALRISRRRARRLEGQAQTRGSEDEELLRSSEEREHALRMLAQVVLADARLMHRERERLDGLARSLRIPRLLYAEILADVEHEVRHRRVVRRSIVAVGALGAIALATSVTLFFRGRTSAEERGGAVGALSDTAAAVRVQESWDVLKEEAQELEERVTLLERRLTQQADRGRENAAMEGELARLRDALSGIQGLPATFREQEAELERAVLLIEVHFDLVQGERRATASAAGTGFFIAPDGHLVTAKHVVEPWKFRGNLRQRLANGWRLDRDSIHIAAWRAGAQVFRGREERDLEAAFHTGDNTLGIVALAPDEWETRSEQVAGGGRFEGLFHTLNASDLALLRARVERPLTSWLPIATDHVPEKLDPVLVLGFPNGTAYLEGGHAEASVSVGTVRRAPDSIFITAPIVPGNSGGPLIDLRGRAIGVASGIAGDPALGRCIHVRHILELLPPPADWFDRAERWVAAGAAEPAAALLGLIELRELEPADRARLEALRAQL